MVMRFGVFALILLGGLLMSGKTRADEPAETIPAPIPKTTSPATLAVRNNNPLNIRESSDEWLGLDTPRASGGFFKFKHPKWGFRAAAKIMLQTYPNRYGIDKIGDMIRRWAPPVENNTNEYIAYVVKRTALPASTVINPVNAKSIMAAMARLESGIEWKASDIQEGINLL